MPQGLEALKLPPPVNETGDSVQCVTEYGRTYYLTIQFTFLAFLVGMQVGGRQGMLAWAGQGKGRVSLVLQGKQLFGRVLCMWRLARANFAPCLPRRLCPTISHLPPPLPRSARCLAACCSS